MITDTYVTPFGHRTRYMPSETRSNDGRMEKGFVFSRENAAIREQNMERMTPDERRKFDRILRRGQLR